MTRSNRGAFALFVVLAATAALAQSAAQKSFDQVKSLAGTWEGKSPMGELQVIFKVTSNGSAVMSEILGHEDMISMVHLDGPNRLMLTHYCAAGNQPRMQAKTSADGKTITFDFVDATNLASPDAGHMRSVVIAVVDPNHHTEEWTFIDHGKEMKELFDLRRKM
ncbi:MAG: hypothetical protein LAO24_19950 [Acidobacteriia bacterium]|nr:hypothetical protein [Terriglobia bacterium]